MLCVCLYLLCNYMFFFCFEACRHGRAMLKAVAAYRLASRGLWPFLLEGFRSFDRSCPCRTAGGRNDSTVLKCWCSCNYTLAQSRRSRCGVGNSWRFACKCVKPTRLGFSMETSPYRLSGWVGGLQKYFENT